MYNSLVKATGFDLSDIGKFSIVIIVFIECPFDDKLDGMKEKVAFVET